MSDKKHIQPEGTFDSTRYGYTQVVTSEPGRLVFISGQVALDAKGKVVGDDVATQAKQALENLGKALAAVGGDASDLTSLRIYIPNFTPEHSMALGPVLHAFLDGAAPPAQTMLGIQSLAMPTLLIEIEAMAVVSDG